MSDDESFAEVLDRMQVDVFLGTRLPQTGRANRPTLSTTAHLEFVPGWVQVFRNVMENALAASEDPVKIEVRCKSVLYKGASALRVSIHDSGPGFEESHRDRIFSPFFTTKPKGTGLGMAIAQRIVEAHGGAIGIGDSDGGGEVDHAGSPAGGDVVVELDHVAVDHRAQRAPAGGPTATLSPRGLRGCGSSFLSGTRRMGTDRPPRHPGPETRPLARPRCVG